MLSERNLDKIICECGYTAFENSIFCGLDRYLDRCSEVIREKEKDLVENEIHNLLYLMKFLWQHWPDTEKQLRINKQLCLKVLFIILLSSKHVREWRQLLVESVKQVSKYWGISPDDYPFLSDQEKLKILNQVDNIFQEKDIHSKFSLIEFKKTMLPDAVFYYLSEKVYNNFIESYRILCRYPKKNNITVRYLKAFFIAVKEHNIVKNFPSILKTLPLYFCATEIRSLLSHISIEHTVSNIKSIISDNKSDFTWGTKLFVKGKKEDDYELIPIWAEWFFIIGQKAAMQVTTSRKMVIGFSLPTRAYAALFFLLGYETINAEKRMKENEKNNAYFNYMSKCEHNEALLICENKRWKRCWFKGLINEAGKEFIKVEVPGVNKYTDLISCSDIVKLRKAVAPEREVADRQIGFETSGIDSLINYYNKKKNEILKFLFKPEISYAVFGNISNLKNEIEHEKLYLNSGGEYTEFSFQHILRFKNFMSEFDLYRGIILSNQKSEELYQYTPQTVIYDGSLAYLNHQDDIKSGMEIVFLDCTEPQFSSACSELMARYCDRQNDVNLVDSIPSAVELVAFRE